ncbi:MAG: glycosyltransferase [Ferruginibacter sp.]|nr:glycosyltransferase [Ferruginibacter sp.]
MEKKKKEILMIVQYPENVSPCQRFRLELYKDILAKNGFLVTTKPFLDKKGYAIVHCYGFFLKKIIALIKGFIGRLLLLFQIGKYDFILLQREVTPVGPPVFEWLYVKLFRKKIIYDFDDAIWLQAVSEQNSVAGNFKNAKKVKNICKWAYKISGGNEYLCNYARQYNDNVIYNPTCVDTGKRYNILANHDVERITIAWTGSYSTLKYLKMVEPSLKALQEKYDFDIKIICNKKPSLNLKNVKFIEWSEENEVSELASCQIGLMPLNNEEWSEGKCGFKLIQYLSLGIPAVSSAIGVNKTIIEEGVNGYFAHSDSDWYRTIEKLILNAGLRKKMGIAGQEKIISQYSLQSNENNFLNLFSNSTENSVSLDRSVRIWLRNILAGTIFPIPIFSRIKTANA